MHWCDTKLIVASVSNSTLKLKMRGVSKNCQGRRKNLMPEYKPKIFPKNLKIVPFSSFYLGN